MYASHRDGSIAFDMCDPFYAKERKELEQFGVAFAQVFDVDLSPYESFSEMIDEVDYAERMQDICVKGLNFLQGEIALAEAVEGEEGIEYNNEMDVDDIAEDISHEILMTRMQRFFKFKDEESN
ncbi:hypothetical protein FLA_1638 [Filimonas lacunae]|nr:hypothetical protein FLA_1638 [Filimonas lacunae]